MYIPYSGDSRRSGVVRLACVALCTRVYLVERRGPALEMGIVHTDLGLGSGPPIRINHLNGAELYFLPQREAGDIVYLLVSSFSYPLSSSESCPSPAVMMCKAGLK